jgi:hypothetical protein
MALGAAFEAGSLPAGAPTGIWTDGRLILASAETASDQPSAARLTEGTKKPTGSAAEASYAAADGRAARGRAEEGPGGVQTLDQKAAFAAPRLISAKSGEFFGLVANATGLTWLSISMMFVLCSYRRGAFHGSALPPLRGRPFAQPGQSRPDVRAGR